LSIFCEIKALIEGVIKPAPIARNETAKYMYVPEFFSGKVINR